MTKRPFMNALSMILILLGLYPTVAQPQVLTRNEWDVFPAVPLTDLPQVLPASPTLVKSLGDAAERAAQWQVPRSAADWERRRPLVLRSFRQALGLAKFPERHPLQARVLATNLFGSIAVENLVFESRPGFVVTANLYRPVPTSPARRPAVVSPIGHFLTPGKTAPEVQARCLGLARRGYVVLVYDAIGQGERMFTGNIHHDAGYALLPLGETIAGWMVWDSMRAVDYLLTRPDVDPDRLGITGNSGGGLNSLFTAAVDERVKAAVIVGFTFEFGNWAKYGGAHCTCTHLPGIFSELNWSEIAGLIAPRAVMMIQGANDNIFPITGARRSGADVATLYRLAGREGYSRFVELAGMPHAYSAPFRENMYGWMAWHLQGQGSGEPQSEAQFETLPALDPRLLCDPDRQWMSKAPTVVDLARARALERLKGGVDVTSSQGRESVLNWITNLTTAPESRPRWTSPRVHRQLSVPGGVFEKVSYLSEDGLRIPGLLWLPEHEKSRGRTLLIADERGKSVVAESALVPTLLETGYTVLAVDLRGRGETLGRYGPKYDTNFRLLANQVLLGEPLAGRRAFDLSRAMDFLAARPELATNEVTLVAWGADALSAALVAAADLRVKRLAIGGSVHSFLSWMRPRIAPAWDKMGDAWNDPQLRGRLDCGDDEIDLGAVVPGSLNVADIPQILSLASPRPLLFCEARDLGAPDSESVVLAFTSVVSSKFLTYQPRAKLNPKILLEWLDR